MVPNALLLISKTGDAPPASILNAVPGAGDTSLVNTEPLMIWLPINVLEPVVANEPVSIVEAPILESTDAE